MVSSYRIVIYQVIRRAKILLTFLGSCLALSISAPTYAQIPPYITEAVNSPERTAEMIVRDEARQPVAMLGLSSVKPGDKVVEFAGFGNYYTTLLSSIVGPQGEVHMFDLPYTEQFGGEGSRQFESAHSNTHYNIIDYNEISLPSDIDVVFNILYYHDLPLNKIDVLSLNKSIFSALKPGGVFFIIDHNAEPGSGTRDIETLHRIDRQVIIDEVVEAGFELAEESNLLRNLDDDHTQMVFSPGTRGATDRSVFKFVKPNKN
jgi:predicted methyltransferase